VGRPSDSLERCPRAVQIQRVVLYGLQVRECGCNFFACGSGGNTENTAQFPLYQSATTFPRCSQTRVSGNSSRLIQVRTRTHRAGHEESRQYAVFSLLPAADGGFLLAAGKIGGGLRPQTDVFSFPADHYWNTELAVLCAASIVCSVAGTVDCYLSNFGSICADGPRFARPHSVAATKVRHQINGARRILLLRQSRHLESRRAHLRTRHASGCKRNTSMWRHPGKWLQPGR